MAQKHTNAARLQLAADITNVATSWSVATGQGALLPEATVGTTAPNPEQYDGYQPWFKMVLQEGTDYEIVYVRTHVAGSDAVSDVLRGREGTTARAFTAGGTVFGLRWTALDASNASLASNQIAGGVLDLRYPTTLGTPIPLQLTAGDTGAGAPAQVIAGDGDLVIGAVYLGTAQGAVRLNSGVSPSTLTFLTQAWTHMWADIGVPDNGYGQDGDFYFRSDGTTGATIYHKRSGVWVGII